MQADLEFEYPQKLEKMIIKADILKLVEEEEVKLKNIAFQKEYEESLKQILTYEEYYNAEPGKETPRMKDSGAGMGRGSKDTPFETFFKERTTGNFFLDDILE